jgi:hypothetical protein
MCLRRAPEKYIAGAALDRAAVENATMRAMLFSKYRVSVGQGWSRQSAHDLIMLECLFGKLMVAYDIFTFYGT